jgi:saccharopine dehydrogenase-like NADP-dependent oxidoreductase
MKTDIIVVGGYGHVGGQICEQLAVQYPGKVYAAGRSFERAQQFCGGKRGKIKPLRLAVGEPFEEKLLERVKLVVMCLDQTDTAFAKACLLAGTDYVDVSANGDFLEAMELMNGSTEGISGTAVLSVGLAPGLTNLLALKAAQSLEGASRIDIAIMLGLGDEHGKAAIEWTVDSLAASYSITEAGRKRRVKSFTEGLKTDFGTDLGKRAAYRFPFSDQQTLSRTLGVPSVSTRLCFDSRLVTRSMALLKGIGFDRLLSAKPVRQLAIQSFGKLRYGSASYAIKVAGYGNLAGAAAVAEFGLQGVKEAEITAMTAIAVVKGVYGNRLPRGVYHIEQLFELELHEQQAALRLKGDKDSSSQSIIDNIRCWSRIQS